jgi:TonB-linked SusC/RagA family outer membrane protein
MYKLIFVLLAFLSCDFLISQSDSVTGTIMADGDYAIGATVYNENSKEGTITDADGFFEIMADVGDRLSISYLGYEDYSVSVTGDNSYNISLVRASLEVGEIVVTALGLERNTKDLGYAVQKLEAEEISSVKAVNFLDNLSGKLAGVTVTQGATGVGSTSKITIRGESSFNNNNPLFVVDGTPVNNNSIINVTNEAAAGFQEVDFGSGAMDINPDDISSLTVLKGPSAAALYGTRASNGVIVITTKDGNESSGLGVSYNTSYFVDSPFALPDFQNSFGQGNSGVFEFVDGLGGGINDNITYSWGPQLDAGLNIAQFDSPVTLADGRIVRGADTALYDDNAITPTPFVSNPDNLKNFYETGSTIINNISIGNQNEFGSFRLSLTDMRSDSYIPGVNLDRQTISGRFNFSPSDRLTINSSVNYIYTTSDNRPASGYGSENINYSLVAWMGRQTNTESLRNYWQPGLEGVQQYSFNYTFFDNPYFILLENRNAFDRNRIFGNISATYQISEKLSVMLRTGLDQSGEDRTFRRSFSSNRFSNGAYAEHNVDYRESNTDILINYNDRLTKKVGLDISVGANRLDQSARTLQTQAIGLAQPGIFKLSNAASPLEVFQFDSDKRINSIYGLLKFSYDDYFYLDITGRNDWSSALATPQSSDNTGFFYPSVSASLLLSKIVNLPEMVSFLKVRASWAQVGNDTNPYQTVGVFQPQTPVGGNPTFSEQTFIANQNLLPEQATAIELGFDFRLLDDRVGLDFTYYSSDNKNQILSLPIAISSGFSQEVTNGGTVHSSGVEVLLHANPIRTRNFRWNTHLNFSRNRSIVRDLPSEVGLLTLAYSRVYDNPNQTVWFIVEEGNEIGDIWGTGYLKNDNGDFIIGQDGRLIVDNTLKKLGNYNPDFILGLTNNIDYKNLSLGFTFDWRYGGQIVSRTQALAGVGGQLKETEFRPEEGLVFDGVINTGTEEQPNFVTNDIAINPESYYRQFYDRNQEENNLYDASYLKLREVQLSYSFSDALLTKTFLSRLENLKLSFIARNVFAISDIPHFDPEQIAVQGNTFVNGVEDMSYPTARSIGISLNANF